MMKNNLPKINGVGKFLELLVHHKNGRLGMLSEKESDKTDEERLTKLVLASLGYSDFPPNWSDLIKKLSLVRFTWNLRKVNNVYPAWYTKECGTFCSQCNLGYDFDDSYKALLLCRAKGQTRGPRCVKCGRILRARSKPNPKCGFWERADKIEGRK